ncbi:MAG: recombination protein RecT [Psychromonas sp.]|jgi:recombination protein RecT
MNDLTTVNTYLSSNMDIANISSLLPPSVSYEAFKRAAVTAMVANSELYGSDVNSVMLALSQCATDGLVPDGREAALVTFKCKVKINNRDEWMVKAQYMPMVDGVIKRVMATGQVKSIASKAIYEGDQFEVWDDETGSHFKYSPALVNRGPQYAAFAWVKMSDGTTLTETMIKEDIDRVRASSKTGSYGPWKDWYDRMSCKSVLRRICTRLPNASEILTMCDQGMNMDFDRSTEKNITPLTEGSREKLKSLCSNVDLNAAFEWFSSELNRVVKAFDDLTEDEAARFCVGMENSQ